MLLHLKNSRRSSLLTCCLAAFLLVGCGGESSSNNSSAPAGEINGTAVPAEPSQTLVNATLAGVDTNGNAVRDEVDRAIARSYGASATDHKAAIAYAAQAQSWLAQDSLTEAKAQAAVVMELEAFECLKSKVGIDQARTIADEVEIRTFHPRLRTDERQRVLQSAGVHLLPTTGVGSC